MSLIKVNKSIQALILIILFLYAQGCAVLTPSQVDAVGDFAKAADTYSQLPGSVINTHADTMLAENIYATASLKDFTPAPEKISKAVDNYLELQKVAANADAALNVIGTYVKLLKSLTANDFNEKLQEEAAALGPEIDGAVKQYNELTGENIDSFGSAVATIVRAGGGIIIRYKQAKALKKAVYGAELGIDKMSKSVVDLMNSYICVVDIKGKCDPDGPGLGQLAEEGLTEGYLYLLKSGKSNNSVKDLQDITQLLIKAKSIKPLAEKTKKAMLTFRTAHNKLYNKLQERRTLKGTIDEIKVLSSEVRSAQKLMKEIENI